MVCFLRRFEAVKTKHLRFVSILALIALLASGWTAFAQQGESSATCNGLSEADCQLLTGSTAAMQSLHSWTMPAWSFNLDMVSGEESVKLAADGSGTLVLPQVLMALASDMPQTTGMPSLQPMITLLKSLDSAKIQQALAELGLYIVVDHFSLQAPGEASSESLKVLFKDSALYIQLESPNGATAWFGDQAELSATDLQDLQTTLGEVITQLQSEDTQSMLAQMSELSGVQTQITALANKYVTTARGADQTLSGQAMAVFTTSFDLVGFLKDPELAPLLLDYLQSPAMAQLSPDLNTTDLTATQIEFVLMTVGLLLKEPTITAEQWVGLDDHSLHKVGGTLGLSIDPSLFGEEAAMYNMALDMSAAVELEDIDTASLAEVAAPTDYRSLDDTSEFLIGSPAMVEAELQPGQTFSGSFTDANSQDIFGLTLQAGQSVQIEITSQGYPYLDIYGPDGFWLDDYNPWVDEPVDLTAETDGEYLLKVTGSGDTTYDLIVRAQ
jgi:hypothetical protein